MTDTTLAEKAAKFLQADHTGIIALSIGIQIPVTGPNLFTDEATAPVLAHLAKRKMEKRGIEWYGTAGVCKKYRYYFMDDTGKLSDVIDENEYKALWLAIDKTGVMDE